MNDKEFQSALMEMKGAVIRIEQSLSNHAETHRVINKDLNNHENAIKGTPGNLGLETRLELIENVFKRWERITMGAIVAIIGIIIERIIGK